MGGVGEGGERVQNTSGKQCDKSLWGMEEEVVAMLIYFDGRERGDYSS